MIPKTLPNGFTRIADEVRTAHGLDAIAYDDADLVRLNRSFLDSPQVFLRALLSD